MNFKFTLRSLKVNSTAGIDCPGNFSKFSNHLFLRTHLILSSPNFIYISSSSHFTDRDSLKEKSYMYLTQTISEVQKVPYEGQSIVLKFFAYVLKKLNKWFMINYLAIVYALYPSRARSLVVSNLRLETKGSRFESGCRQCAELSSLQQSLR